MNKSLTNFVESILGTSLCMMMMLIGCSALLYISSRINISDVSGLFWLSCVFFGSIYLCFKIMQIGEGNDD